MVRSANSYLSSGGEYEVVAPAVVIRRLGGAVERYVYHGARLPSDASPAEIERLEGLGMIRRVSTEGDER